MIIIRWLFKMLNFFVVHMFFIERRSFIMFRFLSMQRFTMVNGFVMVNGFLVIRYISMIFRHMFVYFNNNRFFMIWMMMVRMMVRVMVVMFMMMMMVIWSWMFDLCSISNFFRLSIWLVVGTMIMIVIMTFAVINNGFCNSVHLSPSLI